MVSNRVVSSLAICILLFHMKTNQYSIFVNAVYKLLNFFCTVKIMKSSIYCILCCSNFWWLKTCKESELFDSFCSVLPGIHNGQISVWWFPSTHPKKAISYVTSVDCLGFWNRFFGLSVLKFWNWCTGSGISSAIFDLRIISWSVDLALDFSVSTSFLSFHRETVLHLFI